MPNEELAIPQLTTLQLVSNARRALAEARTLPDFRYVMEAATVATDAAKRAARLMEAQGVAAQVVEQANEAANDAAAVRIEAQAGAGRILREMKAQGEMIPGRQKSDPGSKSRLTTPEALGIGENGEGRAAAYLHAALWQRVADVPDNVRVEYVDETVERGGEITTAGLLRYAERLESKDEPEPSPLAGLEEAYRRVTEAMAVLDRYDKAAAIAAFAADSRRKTKFRVLVEKTRAWVEDALGVLQ